VRLPAAVAIGLCALAPARAEPAPAERRVDPERLAAHLEALDEPRSGFGGPEELAALDEAMAHAERAFREAGYEPTRHAFTHAPQAPWRRRINDRTEWHNLVAERRGAERPHEVLILGAHIDTVPRSPGADDNASGVAALLEIARVLAEGPPPAITVRFVVFNLEEVGLIGARAYASDLRGPMALPIEDGGERPVGMLSLEMLGYYRDEPGSQRSPVAPIEGVFEPPDTGDFLALVSILPYRPFNERLEAAMAEAEPAMPTLRVDFSAVPAPDMMRSDHAPFWWVRVPAVMVTDTANFRNPHYHTPSDTIETLDLKRYARSVRALAGAVERLANNAPAAPERPADRK